MYLGMDFGTGGARACVIDPNGEIEDIARSDFGRLEPHELCAAWRTTLLELPTALPLSLRKRLRGLCIDATSATVLACDSSLRGIFPPLTYDDARAQTEAALITRTAGAHHPTAAATSGLAKVLWLQRHLGHTRAALFLNQADWLTALLTGRPGISDYHNALKSGFDPGVRDWYPWVEHLVDKARLPQVVPPGHPIGLIESSHARAMNVSTDCLIRTGTTDSIAALLATGARAPGDAVTSLGSTLVLKLVSDRRVDDGRLGVYSHWFGALWLAGGASNAGGATLKQFFDADALTALSAQIDAESDTGLAYYPLPSRGERFPVNDPMRLPVTEPRPADPVLFLQGLLEGLARIEAEGYRKLVELGATPPERIFSAGGGSGNPAYHRLRERRLGVPAMPAPITEAAFGAARIARQGVDLFPGAGNDA